MSEQTYWCVFGPDGEILVSPCLTRRSAIYNAEDMSWTLENGIPTWKQLYRRGYRCRKVRIEVCDG